MKCPLYYAELRGETRGNTSDRGECLATNCEWYNHEMGCCALFTISQVLQTIRETLVEIKERIPRKF